VDLRDIGLADLLDHATGHATDCASEHAAASGAVAIVGMAAQVGAAADLAAFWQLLSDGRSAVSSLSAERRAQLADYLRLTGASDCYQDHEFFREAFLPRIDEFDHSFFGLSWQEACLMDPQQRLLLQCAYQALEHAGYAGAALDGSATGVYIGASEDFGENYRALIDTLAPDAPEIAIPGNIRSVLAGRLAYLLNLTGPALVVDTACSSALVAVHLACRALAQGDCQQALVGAVNLNLVPLPMKPNSGIGARDIADNLAFDGQTKAFAAHSDGMSIGEGVFALLLKPLAQAKADGDCIHAVILASAVNQDGRSMGLTAPNGAAQTELLCRAWQQAGIDPAQLSYLEAHGTGTRLGDPIEVSAIRQAFGRYTQRRQFCGLGSVKTNVGHLDNAAGMAGLLKVVMALKQRQLPASLNFITPNAQIAFEQSPVYVQDRLSPWQVSDGQRRLAGVSAFGLSGTNCHLVLAEPVAALADVNTASDVAHDASYRALQDAGLQLMLLSARSPADLQLLCQRFASWFASMLAEGQLAELPRVADLCFTLQTGRPHFCYRLALWGNSMAALATALQAYLAKTDGAWQQGAFRLVATDNVLSSQTTNPEASERRLLTPEAQQQLSAQAQALLQQALLQQEKLQQNFGSEALVMQSHADVASSHHSWREWVVPQLAALYVQGAQATLWQALYQPTSEVRFSEVRPNAAQPSEARRCPLPGYPLQPISCWLSPTPAGEQLAKRQATVGAMPGIVLPTGPGGQPHPLFDSVVVSRDRWLAHKRLSLADWALAEHQIDGVAVLPGTCYVEMLLALVSHYRQQLGLPFVDNPLNGLTVSRLQFLQPLLLASTQQHIDLYLELCPEAAPAPASAGDDQAFFSLHIYSRSSLTQLHEHASAQLQLTVSSTKAAATGVTALAHWQATLSRPVAFLIQDDIKRGLQISDRWYGSFVAGFTDATATNYLFEFSLDARYHADLPLYWFHPALLDTAINAANHLMGEGDLYLPFFYQGLVLQQSLTAACYFVLTPLGARTGEIIEFQVTIYADDGRLLASVARYGIKKASQFARAQALPAPALQCYQLALVPETALTETQLTETQLTETQLPAAQHPGIQSSAAQLTEPAVSVQLPAQVPAQVDKAKLGAALAAQRVLLLSAAPVDDAMASALAGALTACQHGDKALELVQQQVEDYLASPSGGFHQVIYLAGAADALLHGSNNLSGSGQHTSTAIHTAGEDLTNATTAEQALTAVCDLQRCLQQLLLDKAPVAGVLVLTGLASDTDPTQAALAAYSQVAALENPQLALRNLQLSVHLRSIGSLGGDGSTPTLAHWQGLAALLLQDLQERGWPQNPQLPARLIWRASLQPSLQQAEAATSLPDISQQAHAAPQSEWLAETLTLATVTAAKTAKDFVLRPGGGYLITGGAGGLGFALASRLAAQAQASGQTIHLLLTGSSATPTVAVHSLAGPLVEVQYQQVDAADAVAMAAALAQLRASVKSGIAGVFHLAGRAGAGFMHQKTLADSRKVLAAKLAGGWHLHQLTQTDRLDCFVCYSSVLAWFPEAGQSDYAAANRYLDALCKQRRAAGLPGLALCWPAWQETGMALLYDAVRYDELFLPLKTSEALDLLWQLLATQQAYLGHDSPAGGDSSDHSNQLSQQLQQAALLPARLNPKFSLSALPELATPLAAPLIAWLSQQTSQQLLQPSVNRPAGLAVQLQGIQTPDQYDSAVEAIWGQVLGVTVLDADDHFNDLGGNSILVTQQYKAFEQQFPGAIEMTDLFSKATVRQQAALLRQHLAGKTAPAGSAASSAQQTDLAQLEAQLARLAAGEISPEQAAALI